jgi:site-specific DNA-methyltransferase (adenine-specific)
MVLHVTEPYYEDDYVTLYLGDCLQILDWLHADVLITDPPYGLNSQLSNQTPSRKRRHEKARAAVVHDKPTWDSNLDVRDQAMNLWGTTRPYAVFGSPARLDGALPYREFPLVWDKLNVGMGNTDFPWGRSYELIYVNGPGWHTDGDKRSSSILRVQHVTHHARDEGHPTPKPLPLMGTLVRKAPPGTIADPFTGSGATLAAAKHAGRQAIGVELEEQYAERAARRLQQEVLFA